MYQVQYLNPQQVKGACNSSLLDTNRSYLSDTSSYGNASQCQTVFTLVLDSSFTSNLFQIKLKSNRLINIRLMIQKEIFVSRLKWD